MSTPAQFLHLPHRKIEDFADSIKAEKREWTLGKKLTTHTHKEVMKLSITMYDNLSVE